MARYEYGGWPSQAVPSLTGSRDGLGRPSSVATRWQSISFILSVFALAPCLAHADGGTVRASQRSGDRQITVFTAPTPLRAGPVDVSVLMQDRATGETLFNDLIDIEIAPNETPSASSCYRASHAAATNKLLQAAQFDLPYAGRWLFTVKASSGGGSTTIRFEVNADDAPPTWRSLWLWFSWPFMVVAYFAAVARSRGHRGPARMVVSRG